MAAPPPQQGSPQSDNSLAPFWIIAAVFVSMYLIWTVWHVQIVEFYLKIKLYEAIAVSYFTTSINPIIAWLNSLTPASYAKMTPNQLIEVSEIIGRYLRWPVLALCLLFGIYIYHFSPRLRFRHTYTMQALVLKGENEWPQIMPVVKLDLIHTPLDQGPWASAETPLQFVKKHKIFKEMPIETAEPVLAHKVQYYVSLTQDQAYRVFNMQLGKQWTGIDNLPIYAQALFAAFAAKGNGKSTESAEFLTKIARSSKEGTIDFSGTKELLHKYANTKEVQKVVNNHAYVLTAMASMLQFARQDGVLCSADFLWLKPIDRPLWYMLNNVGRQTAFVEIAGAFAHWKTELEFGHPLTVPMVSEAVKALDAALKEILYIPEDLKDA